MRRGILPDLVTDQTSAHDPLIGYIPTGMWPDRPGAAPRRPRGVRPARNGVDGRTRRGDARAAEAGRHVFDYGNNIRGMAKAAGYTNAFDFQAFVPLYIRPLFCAGVGLFRWAALSGGPEDIARADHAVADLPRQRDLTRWIRSPRTRSTSRACPPHLLARLRRAHLDGLGLQQVRRRRRVGAPIAIGRDHLDSGSLASPYPATEEPCATAPTRSPTGPSSTPCWTHGRRLAG